MKKPCIFIYTPSYPPVTHGVAQVARNMAQILSKELEVHVLTPASSDQQKLDGEVRLFLVKVPSRFKVFIFLKLLLVSLKHRKKRDCKLIYALGSVAGTVAMIIGTLFNTPYLISIHKDDLFEVKGIRDIVTKLSIMPIVRRAKYVHVPFQKLAIITSQILKIPLKKFVAIPYPVSEKYFKIQSTYNEKGFIFACGSLMKRKRFDLLIQAFAKALNNGVQTDLVIAGEGNQRQELIRLAKELEIEDRVKLLGNVTEDELIELYSKCLFYVSTSEAELFGMTMAEAMSAGKPIIATYTLGAEYLVKTNVNGFLIHADNDSTIADGIQRLSSDPNLIKTMGMNSRKIAEAELSPAIFRLRFIRLLKETRVDT